MAAEANTWAGGWSASYILAFDIATWGWIHLILGVIVLVAGFALFSGAVWARIVGVMVANLASVAAFAWLPWYPIWAIVLISMSVAAIWALTAHGDDLSTARGDVSMDG